MTAAKGLCSIVGCSGPVRSLGWCSPHYYRSRRHGAPDLPPLLVHDPEAKRKWLSDLAAMEPTGGCVDWPWGSDGSGYALFRVDGGPRRVTHLVLALVGRQRPAPPSDQILHACDRPICCAPWHLRWGTQAENVADSWNRTRR